MLFFTNCSGECQDCMISYVGTCFAGHGDDYFVPVRYDELDASQKKEYDRRHGKAFPG